MTIKGLTAYLKKNYPSAFMTAQISDFAGTKMAIDSGIIAQKYGSGVYAGLLAKLKIPTDEIPHAEFITEMKKSVISFALGLMKRGIRPVFCFDGKRHPLKQKTLEKRSTVHTKNREDLKDAVEEYESLNPLEITSDADKRIMQLRSRTAFVGFKDQDELMSELVRLGIPCHRAEYEAEKLAASLFQEGIVDAVITKDCDVYALGVGLTITDYDFKMGTFEVTDMTVVLEAMSQELNLSIEETQGFFLDACIMSGCDFNENVRDVSIVRSIKLLKEYGSFEGIVMSKYGESLGQLNYAECRSGELLGYGDSNLYSDDTDLNWTNFENNIEAVLEEYDSHPMRAVARGIQRGQLSDRVVKHDNGI
jgi:5'-3' exonuclease